MSVKASKIKPPMKNRMFLLREVHDLAWAKVILEVILRFYSASLTTGAHWLAGTGIGTFSARPLPFKL